MDVRCPCGRSYGWAGAIDQWPPCPACGREADIASIKATTSAIDEARKAADKRIRKKHREKWFQPTDVQLRCYAEGRNAAIRAPNDAPLTALELAPYTPGKCGVKFEDDPDHRHQWWREGWADEWSWRRRMEEEAQT